MIKINLLGRAKVKAARAPRVVRTANVNQAIQLGMAIAVIFISIAIVYVWQLGLAAQNDELTTQINLARKEKKRQEAFAKENEVFEERRKLLERRIEVIESLKKNQSGPVQVLDLLSDCVQRTQGLWLQELNQKGRVFSLRGIVQGSPDVVADFITSLQRIGNFQNVELINIQEQNDKYAFAISFEGEMMASLDKDEDT